MALTTVSVLVGCGGSQADLTVDLPGGVTMDFVRVEAGTFLMGSPVTEAGRDDDESPQHEVVISNSYYLSATEITQAQWSAVMGTQPWSGQAYVLEQPEFPASYLSWDDLQALCATLNELEGDILFRLPTEAEWEYACRAGTQGRWSFGDTDTPLSDHAWHAGNTWDEGLQHAQAVRTKSPNPWGLYDMHGNLFEWVQDGYSPYPAGGERRIDPLSTVGTQKVLRGGYFHSNGARRLRSANRLSQRPEGRYASVGGRLVRQLR